MLTLSIYGASPAKKIQIYFKSALNWLVVHYGFEMLVVLIKFFLICPNK